MPMASVLPEVPSSTVDLSREHGDAHGTGSESGWVRHQHERRLRRFKSSIMKPIAASNANQAVHRVKSSNQLQVIDSSWEYPNLLRDKHRTLPTIQSLQLSDQLLILTSPKFPLGLVNAFKAALASNYSQPPTIIHCCYSPSVSDWHVQAPLTTANKIIIFIYNVDMHQKAMVEKTIDKRPLVIMMGPPSTVYLEFLKDVHLSGSVLTLLQPSVKGLQNTATLIKTTAALRR